MRRLSTLATLLLGLAFFPIAETSAGDTNTFGAQPWFLSPPPEKLTPLQKHRASVYRSDLQREIRKRRGRKPRRTGHNLLLRLQARKEDALRFLANLAVPFTNNQAEQDVRMAKLKQKISGGFRSEQGANDFATIRGFISTAKKQGWNIIPALMENPETLIARLRDA